MNVAAFGSSFDLDEELLGDDPATVERQIRAYEAGERRAFDLDVRVPDSFTGRVMEAMRAVPYGETRAYGDLARELDTAPVAVGRACARNPVPLVVPCHRVVAAEGLGGFSAPEGLALKRRLLDHEAGDRDGRERAQATLEEAVRG